MKIFKTKQRLIALLLCMTMMLGLMPGTANALELTTTDEGLSLSTDGGSSEVVALREENIKHFDMGNGTFQAIAYSHPIHKLDSDGNWQDIDFGLTLTGTRSSRMYSNEAAGAAFAENYVANQPIMALSSEENTFSMSLITTSVNNAASRGANTAVAAEVTNPQNSFQTIEGAKSATFSSKILYEEVLPGVDLEYIVDPGTVKENIIVREKAPSYQYAFRLDLSGLYPVMQDDGSVILYDGDSDTKEYEIPAPFMYDALGNASEDISYTLNGSENSYTLTVTANADWINAEDRSFPVAVDSGIVKETGLIDDSYIDSDSPSTAHGSKSLLWVRANRVTYIKTPTPTIPKNMELSWARLAVFYYYFDHVSTGGVAVTAHRMTNSWQESTLTWDQALNMSGYYGLSTSPLDVQVAYASVGARTNNPKQIDFVITSAVKEWLDGTYSNHGIGLKYVDGSTNLSVVFKSSEANYDYRPRIIYQYENIYEYVNYYDNSMTTTQIGHISSAVSFANVVYNSQFGMTFYSNGSPIYKGTLADECELDSDEKCSYKCDTHHKNVHYISEQLYSEIKSSRERIVYWTDRATGAYCSHALDGMCLPYDLIKGTVCIAVVFDCRPVIHIMNLRPDNGNSEQDLACMSINLVHETAHTFGLDDRYTGYSHNDDGYQCVMEYYLGSNSLATDFYKNIRDHDVDAFCSGCASDLIGLIFE